MSTSPGRRFWDAEVVLSPSAAEFHSPHCITCPYDPAPLDLTVFVSCYNEAVHIAETLETVSSAAREVGLGYEIIVIDDASKDNSREVVADYIARHPEERIVLRANRSNRGLAQNYFDAAFLGKGKYYRLMCGDNTEPEASVAAVFSAVGSADIIVPYYTSIAEKSLKRRIISSTYTHLVNLITGYRLHYYNGLAVHLRHNVMRWHPNTPGFGFQADILCHLLDLGFTHLEVPIVAIEQKGKSSALTLRNFLSVASTLVSITNRRIWRRIDAHR
jgi:glycosyltransferase involved in cell wall biosynthesis